MLYKNKTLEHPGNILASCLKKEGISQKNLSERTGLSEKHISQMINGEAPISIETALLLENVLSPEAFYWVDLDKKYQEQKARIKRSDLAKNEVSLLSEFPYENLMQRGLVSITYDNEERVKNLWKFFGVGSLVLVRFADKINFRKKQTSIQYRKSIDAWLRCGELEYQKIVLPKYSKSGLKKILSRLRAMSLLKPKKFLSLVKKELFKVGVAVVYVPHFTNTKISGAMRWFGKNPLVQLSIYYKYADIFWFNLFHELGHVLLHSKKDVFIEDDNKQETILDKREREADEFAGNQLIPRQDYQRLLKLELSEKEIKKFARDLGIHPGIVVGRLCHEKTMEWDKYRNLQMKIADEDLS